MPHSHVDEGRKSAYHCQTDPTLDGGHMTYVLKSDEPDEPLERIVAPFTDEQVVSIAKWQRWGSARPKCQTHQDPGLMTVTTDGIRCKAQGCAHSQDWAYAYVLKANYCIKDAPYPVPGNPQEYVIHVDAVEIDPDCDGEIIPFHCPNCGLDFDVDYR